MLLSGSTRMSTAIRDHFGPQFNALVVEVPGGRRGAGVNESAFEAHVEEAVDSYLERRRERVLAEFRAGHGGRGAVSGIEDVVACLNRGQVKDLILLADVAAETAFAPGEDAHARVLREAMWTGPDKVALAADPADLPDSSGRLEKLPAAVAMIRSAVSQDAGLTFAPLGSVDLYDGVGATLRWHDESTPSEVAAMMSRDKGLLR